jgi:hypothetical protein
MPREVFAVPWGAVGPKTGVDAVDKRKISAPKPRIVSWSTRSLVAIPSGVETIYLCYMIINIQMAVMFF